MRLWTWLSRLWLLVVVYFVVYDCQGCLVLFVAEQEEEEGNLQ
jgi:hypothetical protein